VSRVDAPVGVGDPRQRVNELVPATSKITS
jgi:hypothetical protein